MSPELSAEALPHSDEAERSVLGAVLLDNQQFEKAQEILSSSSFYAPRHRTIYRAIETYDPTRALRPWVFTIATNKLRDHWRSRRHHEAQTDASLERDAVAEFVPSESPAPDAGALRDERDAELRAAVDGLPEGMRITLVLRIYDGLSFEEIARILDRNEVAVRKRYSRALEALRTGLAQSPNLHPEGAG